MKHRPQSASGPKMKKTERDAGTAGWFHDAVKTLTAARSIDCLLRFYEKGGNRKNREE